MISHPIMELPEFHTTCCTKSQAQFQPELIVFASIVAATAVAIFPLSFWPNLYENSISRVDTGQGNEDVVCRVSVEGLLEKLLVEVVTHETDRSTQNEKTVETTREDNQ